MRTRSQALIEDSSPGEGSICRDGDAARPRELIQQQVVSLIDEFLRAQEISI
ncbi:hypothetical protein [Pseudomonas mucidolens]|uniref:hypothetical protein n=1 Tax=Pseudomonas mucidolens TaxID=46679 RepID=UPI00157CA5A4|nr:hypothetical protein [Pseudomonas mucidolens]